MKKSIIDIPALIMAYNETPNLHKVAKEFHTSHIRIAEILRENGVVVQNAGKRIDVDKESMDKIIEEYQSNNITMADVAEKYSVPLKKLRKLFRENGVTISRWNGHEKKVSCPKTTREPKVVKKCSLCKWETTDIENKANSYQTHLKRVHGYTDTDFLKHAENYPEDIPYIIHELNRLKNKVQCKVCGKYLSIIDDRHLSKHGMAKEEYLQKYCGAPIISGKYKNALHENYEKMLANKDWERFSSSYEKEIQQLLSIHGLSYTTHDRTLLEGNREIDVLCGNIGIEFNGCLQHTEWFGGKTRDYHLKKTEECNANGIQLIQIFEDEFVYKKDIVYSKLSHLLKIDENLPKIYGRSCSVKEISVSEAEAFLEKNHIQGFVASSIYYGAFIHGYLVGVMSFRITKKGSNSWELTRFASDITKCCCGVGGRLFAAFLKTYNPSEVKSFADRRWTINPDNNLYTKLGFENMGFLPPSYTYYYLKDNKPKRFHKFGFRKQVLHKKYGLSMDLSETLMVKQLGYDRIWDCGLIKYVWKKRNGS